MGRLTMRQLRTDRNRRFDRPLGSLAAAIGVVAGLLAFASPGQVMAQAAGNPVNSFETTWAALIAAAKKEGSLSIASGGAPSRQYRPTVDAFQKKFGIKTQVSTGNANDTTNRILAERKAGKNTVDLALISTRVINSRFIPAGALIPMPPLLIHPEVADLSKWHGGKHWYGDEESKYNFIYHASIDASYTAWYNTEKVSPEDLKTLKTQWDMFDPRWKGRLQGQAMNDPSGVRQMADSWNEPDRGPEWVRKYLTDGGVTFSSDRRILENWLVGGRFHLWPVTQAADEMLELQSKGLPIASVDLHKERAALRAAGSGCCLAVFERAPNPNAAKLFVNWFLSKEGQTLTHSTIPSLDRASLREDIPQGQAVKDHIRPAGASYDFPDADPTAGARMDKAQAEVMKVWESRPQR